MSLWKQHGLVNMDQILNKAVNGKYAVLHINSINFDWIKTTILTAQETHSPIIVAVTEKSMNLMCGPEGFSNMVFNIMKFHNINVPVVLHLDHGSFDGAKKALEAGFSSVMFDGSHLPFEENLAKTKEIIELAKSTGASVEAEVGPIGGKEDNTTGKGEQADPIQCKKICDLGVSALAAGIGNIHGLYPKNWKGLDFNLLSNIHNAVGRKALVLHGGTGIPNEQVKKAISLGIAKVNVATETLVSYTEELCKYFMLENDKKDHGYDPRKYFPLAYDKVKEKIIEKLKLTGSLGKEKTL